MICARCRREGYFGRGEFAVLAPMLDFTPVPRKKRRHDGWTPERQRGFIEALAKSGSVARAAEAVNMAKEGAYQLRLHPEAAEFRRAWDAALDYGVRVLADAALDRAIHGVPVPIMHAGEQVGERRVFNERLTMFHLRHRLPRTYGHGGLGRGTRHPDTLAREARAVDGDDSDEEARALHRVQVTEAILDQYSNVCQQERQLRRAGRDEEADFYMRQLTHIELVLKCGGDTIELTRHAFRVSRGEPPPAPLTPAGAELLDELRQAGWHRAEHGLDPLIVRKPGRGREAEEEGE